MVAWSTEASDAGHAMLYALALPLYTALPLGYGQSWRAREGSESRTSYGRLPPRRRAAVAVGVESVNLCVRRKGAPPHLSLRSTSSSRVHKLYLLFLALSARRSSATTLDEPDGLVKISVWAPCSQPSARGGPRTHSCATRRRRIGVAAVPRGDEVCQHPRHRLRPAGRSRHAAARRCCGGGGGRGRCAARRSVLRRGKRAAVSPGPRMRGMAFTLGR